MLSQEVWIFKGFFDKQYCNRAQDCEELGDTLDKVVMLHEMLDQKRFSNYRVDPFG